MKYKVIALFPVSLKQKKYNTGRYLGKISSGGIEGILSDTGGEEQFSGFELNINTYIKIYDSLKMLMVNNHDHDNHHLNYSSKDDWNCGEDCNLAIGESNIRSYTIIYIKGK
jgi:hypothetical protein